MRAIKDIVLHANSVRVFNVNGVIIPAIHTNVADTAVWASIDDLANFNTCSQGVP